MNDFNRDYERDYDHLDELPEPEGNDLQFNRKVKLTAAVAMILISVMIVLDLIGYFERWGDKS